MNNSIEDNSIMNNSIEDNSIMNNSIEDNSIMNNSIEDNSIMNNSIEDNSIMNNSIEMFILNDNITFKTKNGNIFQWKKKNILDTYILTILNEDKNSIDCGNPWNYLNEYETQFIIKNKPIDTNLPCNIKSIIENNFITIEDSMNLIKELLYSDCYGVFKINKNKTQFITYCNLRNNKDKNNINFKILNNLRNNFIELLDDILDNKIICIILGKNDFYEHYFEKINDNILHTSHYHYNNFKR
jgi:hypothetical protein